MDYLDDDMILRPIYKVYFLNLDDKLPKWYKHLAEYFAVLDITVVPVNIEQLKKLTQNKVIHVIVSETNFRTKRRLRNQLKNFLGFAVRNNMFYLHHISSFRMVNELIELNQKKHYYFYKLPFSMATFCLFVASEFFQQREEKLVWPGGRRAKLPEA